MELLVIYTYKSKCPPSCGGEQIHFFFFLVIIIVLRIYHKAIITKNPKGKVTHLCSVLILNMFKYYSEDKVNVLLISYWENMCIFICTCICFRHFNSTWLNINFVSHFTLMHQEICPAAEDDKILTENLKTVANIVSFFLWAAFLIGQEAANILSGALVSP